MINLDEFRKELISEGWDYSFIYGMSDNALEFIFELKYGRQ